MMREVYVANTDNDWFDFLRARHPLEEVNFWKPSRQIFRAIGEGGIFAFRLKAPRNVIGGYGILASSIDAPIKLAWDGLGVGNGVDSLEAMITSINRYRSSRDTTMHSIIGCRLLVEPVFFDESEWFPIPENWSQNIVTGKTYSGTIEGESLLRQLEERTSHSTLFERDRKAFEGLGEPLAAWGAPTLRKVRLGQGAFRMNVTNAYGYSCAVTGTRVLPALDAAHIRPFGMGGSHSLTNGLLLRKDVHSVFDEGFVTFDKLKFRVSDKVRTLFNNGHEYLRLSGAPLVIPQGIDATTLAENLQWHHDNCFIGD